MKKLLFDIKEEKQFSIVTEHDEYEVDSQVNGLLKFCFDP